ncbi:hypothetical protein AMJ80_10490 [bacterium SM23_31]|nr:MAG: hypothetical protein AMJ80_10490 [bacterium SM23_31]
MQDLIKITQNIKSKALALGFDKVGTARAVTLDGTFLSKWLSRNYHGTMSWMSRTAGIRLNPKKYLPGARSVIAVAVNYYTEDPPRPPGSAQVSRYALGRDYHLVLGKMLESLLEYIHELLPDVKGKIAVDDAPVMDKIWAYKAGIGWIGKHSNLITRELGSYVFLGEILLTAGLQYDEPIQDYCGSCTRCIDACPTGAILDDKVLDSNKCISYRTIEYRGDFTEEWEGKNQDWIFGCDVCQEVCPWNIVAAPTNIPDFLLADGKRFPLLSNILQLTPEEFQMNYKDSPIKRSKWEGLLRNAEYVRKGYLG